MQVNVATEPTVGRATQRRPRKPVTVTTRDARELLSIKKTKFWELVRDGKLKMVAVGRSRLVVYSSIEALLSPEAQ